MTSQKRSLGGVKRKKEQQQACLQTVLQRLPMHLSSSRSTTRLHPKQMVLLTCAEMYLLLLMMMMTTTIGYTSPCRIKGRCRV